jgi:hypothetical protein
MLRQIHKQKSRPREPQPIDRRTPSGKPLPY